MDNAQLLKVQTRFLLFGGISLGFNLLFVVLALCKRSEIDRNYKIDHERFYESVRIGTSNYLAMVTNLKQETRESSRINIDDVQVVFCDLSTWSDFHGRDFCRVDGNDYSTGDFTPYGLVVRIASDKVYVQTSSGVVILRRKPSGGDGDARPARAPRPGGHGEEES